MSSVATKNILKYIVKENGRIQKGTLKFLFHQKEDLNQRVEEQQHN